MTLRDRPTPTFSINDKGAITGFYDDANQTGHGFVRAADGTITTFDPSGSTRTEGDAINDKGVIAGSYLDTEGGWHGYVRAADGTITAFDPAESATFVQGINEKGAISGLYYDENSVGHGFVRSANGKITRFSAPNANLTEAWHINSNGVIAGWWYRNFNSDAHGFLSSK